LLSTFRTHLVRIGGGPASAAAPVAWKGRVTEQQLEDLLVANPPAMSLFIIASGFSQSLS